MHSIWLPTSQHPLQPPSPHPTPAKSGSLQISGLDNLDLLFLKLSAKIVATPITSLFNLSFVSSEIAKDWKAAAVIPLFKGGDTLDTNCYRPISILPCHSKVFESQVNKQITDHFKSHHTSPLCNLVSELVTGAPQTCLRY